MFAIVEPAPLFDTLTKTLPDPEQQKKAAEAKKSLESLDCLVFQVSANPKMTHFDGAAVFTPGSPGFAKLPKIFPAKFIKGAAICPAEMPAFAGLIRPPDLAAAMADAQRDAMNAQFQTLKGMLQAQTGLAYDTDVAPWWGGELDLMLTLPEQGMPELAILFDSLDNKASQETVAKMVKHLKFAQNREFDEKKIGKYTVSVVRPMPQQQQQLPINPSVCALDSFLVIGTGPSVVETIAQADKKLAENRSYKALEGTHNVERMAFSLFVKSELFVKAKAMGTQQPGTPVDNSVQRFADQVESLLVGLGSPDQETVRLSVIFNAKGVK
ncbi:MAG: DUF3352 domain-containing protein [Candidatus Riflebacteria bacterium]|nr:DUF3352 domain-containing protein [Candidatus Riflebacteria bacterium]